MVLKMGPLDRESSTLTTRPLHLGLFQNSQQTTDSFLFNTNTLNIKHILKGLLLLANFAIANLEQVIVQD